MRPLLTSGSALAALLLAGAAALGTVGTPERGGAEPRPESALEGVVPGSTPLLAVRSPTVSFRIPSSLAIAESAVPFWVTRLAEERPVLDRLRTPLSPMDDAGVLAGGVANPADAVARSIQERDLEPHEFYFTRAAYTGGGGFGGGWGGRRQQAWATDFPKADRQFMVVLRRLSTLDAFPDENAVLLNDPNIRRFPFLYALEVGYMNLRPEEITGLRDYLDAGGFLMVDDFWGVSEWRNFEYHMSMVFPGRPIQDIPADHPLFDMVYRIDEVLQVPALGRGIYGRPTWERSDAVVPTVSGIFDDEGRLMVVINWNTDLGDAWEHAENPMYPVEYSTYAFKVGVNTIVYGMSH